MDVFVIFKPKEKPTGYKTLKAVARILKVAPSTVGRWFSEKDVYKCADYDVYKVPILKGIEEDLINNKPIKFKEGLA